MCNYTVNLWAERYISVLWAERYISVLWAERYISVLDLWNRILVNIGALCECSFVDSSVSSSLSGSAANIWEDLLKGRIGKVSDVKATIINKILGRWRNGAGKATQANNNNNNKTKTRTE